MSEEAIMFATINAKLSALEMVLGPEQLEAYRGILQRKKEGFISVFGRCLTEERLEEALDAFEI